MNRRCLVAASIALATAELGAATSCSPGPAPATIARHGSEPDTLTVAGWVLDEVRAPASTTSTSPTTALVQVEPPTTEPPPALELPEPEPEPEPVATTVRRTTTTTRRTTTTVYEPPSPQGRTVEPAGDVWWQLALCESGGNPATNTGNGYYGAFQFSLPTWRSVGESGYPSEYSYAHQLAAAQRLQARSGWGQWPACSRRLGLV